jgi:hypothetical protein
MMIMSKFLFFLLALLHAGFIQAQPFAIKGVVRSGEGPGLPSATLMLLQASDSTLVNYGISDNEGHFKIQGVAPGKYLLRVTYVGYATTMIPVENQGKDMLDLGEIRLLDEQTVLREFILQEERIPMRIRGDTIEYDALAFKAQPNEVVEDLLRRMPGIEVQADGSILAQGEQVQRMLVDGREFFGRDPQMATKNLPADAISRVHVFDERSEQARFSGIDDGQRERTMNLELKEDRRKGMFGNTTLGYGPNNRYTGSTNLNSFNDKGRFSLLGMANNLNQHGFSVGDFVSFSTGVQGFGGGRTSSVGVGQGGGVPINMDGRAGSNGLMTSMAGGLNVSQELFKGGDFTGSYFYDRLGHDLEREVERENFLPQGNYDFRQFSMQESNNKQHRLSLRLDQTLNENNSLLFTTTASFSDSEADAQSSSTTYSTSGQVQNTSDQTTRVEAQRMNINSGLLWRRRFATQGRTFSAGVDLVLGQNEQEGQLRAMNRFYGPETEDQALDQLQLQDNNQQHISATASYTEPLGNRMYLEANYRISRNKQDVDQGVYDMEQGLSVRNPELSNAYQNTRLYQRAGVNYSINRDDWTLILGGGLQQTILSGALEAQAQLRKEYVNALPSLRFNYAFSNARRLSFNYDASVREPSLEQLQPLVDNNDPLNIRVGNPDLRPAYIHQGNLRLHTFNPATFFGFFVTLSGTYTRNPISHSVSLDDRMVRTIMPVNTGSHFSAQANLNLNYHVSALKSRISVSSSINHRQSTDVLNATEQRISNNTLNASARYHFRPSDAFELNVSGSLNQQLTAYAFSSLEQAFLNQVYTAELFWGFLEHYRIQTSMHYQIYEGRQQVYDQRIPMMDAGLSRRFLKGETGELRLTAYNLLDRDLGISQSMNLNYSEYQETNSLGRYFLLSFTYSLRR